MSTKRRVVEAEVEMEDREFDELDARSGLKQKFGTGIPVTPIRPSRPTQLLDTLMLQRLMEDEPKQSCQRQGVCCTRIMLPQSPRQMRESYNAWVNLTKEGQQRPLHMTVSPLGDKHALAAHLYGEIELIYPMLAGRCLGKMYLGWSGEDDIKRMHRVPKPAARDKLVIGADARADMEPRFVYGPCKHFAWKATTNSLRGECTIHAIRPGMCRNYPNYGTPMGRNMGMWQGCGYNVDADYGLSEADFKEPLEQLEDNEV